MKKIRIFSVVSVLFALLLSFGGCSPQNQGADIAPPGPATTADTAAPDPGLGASSDSSGIAPESATSLREHGDSESPRLISGESASASISSGGGAGRNLSRRHQIYDYIRPGMLTAGVWNDNENHSFILNLMQTNEDFRTFQSMWHFNLSTQVTAVVTDNGRPVNNVRVELLDEDESVVFSARTNNRGRAYLFVGMNSQQRENVAYIRASGRLSVTVDFDNSKRLYEIDLAGINMPEQQQSLDLMFTIDTTGSMGDELDYLKVELADIVRQVSRAHTNTDIRLSVIVYRDVGDDYVVRVSPFTRDIDSQITFLEAQYAEGGGDWEEAVEQALDASLEQDWNDNSTARLMFLVLDAPPHNTDWVRSEMHRLTRLSSDMGVRIIPVASSGIDTVTEFLLRTLSMATGGTYVFLTEDSGIGEGHIEPTIGEFEVELLNELLVRVINDYLD